MPQILTTAEPVPPVLFLCASRSPPLFSFSKLTPSRSRSSSFKIKPCCQKMFVPGFGEASPEAKAATNLLNFFTFLAVKIVLAQLESYNPEAYEELMEFISRHSLNDGNKFCANLMRESPRHQTLALRILEVRSAYCKRDFEWDNLKRLAFKMVDESNTKLMRDYVLETSHVENEKS
ncbi:hypothetical protein MRB53_012052 [Persea americana]|uniref:Uncharacterized protein n=1 Tax=Persea americana TaxID=3435 RepID=A0ACC2LWJ6_PERAE|nr:hypothetical protein MRB53_012052 [Persea americana]|eukprot:TRINITY_DN10715_c0_g2_i1.p1 TRINITY_DN10715_c0_g2~~TRINITY_DN10715_c0_g2_i1.p1  ORF type:complete len:205 (+),score=35.65 TRINITY_DN10715_c0_g2_i1:85-615(+)